MDAPALGRFINEHYNQQGDRLFRMEVLPEYDVTSDDADFRHWLEGATEPTWSRKQPWLDTLRRERENGQISKRVRILSGSVTDYERYACDFGYRYNGAYEDIRILHRGEHKVPSGLIERDFWIIGDSVVVTMHYDEHGGFEGADVTDPAGLNRHLQTRDAAWAASEPFARWWARHPELHRRAAA
ncbi:MAG: hypothetical protein DLM62_18930 [Pseudonocardiales bacterium]|nr:MAG: hypothetical protein DLM62_18930 [Pseudonocardiales bacterium]